MSEVEPEDGLDAIFAHTSKVTPLRSRWLPAALVAAVAAAVVVGGVVALHLRDASSVPPLGRRDGSSTHAAGAPGRTVEVPVYYLGPTAAGTRLFREDRTVESATGDDVEVAVNLALGSTASDPDYHTGFPDGTTASVGVEPAAVVIRLHGDGLSDRPAGMSAADAVTAVQAIVYTAEAASKAPTPVRFDIVGTGATPSVLGVPIDQAVTRASPDSVVSPVSIEAPTEGASVPSTFTVSGLAATSEANVVWELTQGDRVVTKGFTTAHECCTLSPYSLIVQAPPGEYTLVVHDDDPSGGEGAGITEDTKHVTVTP